MPQAFPKRCGARVTTMRLPRMTVIGRSGRCLPHRLGQRQAWQFTPFEETDLNVAQAGGAQLSWRRI